jgi:hypothetical protein|tara:strand:+ start:124 stop:420 length:297 start_codon:yes stop_codon:yes gene_type:complete
MSITFEIASKTVGDKGEITSVSFKALKATENGSYKTYGECSFNPDIKATGFIPLGKVTDKLVVDWITENVGVKGVKALEALLSNRIKKEVKPSKKASS